MFSITHILNELECPMPFAPGAELWNDPHISKQMLAAHLSPDTDAASYKPETIKAICSHLPRVMGLHKGASIVDLGCGPGLYAKEFTGQGFFVTGVDRSESSIRYARENAGRQAEFINANYLEPFGKGCFDAAIMISKDFGVLPSECRQTLLCNIRTALTPGGYFALDVHSLYDYAQRKKNCSPHWEAANSGFWRPYPYVDLSKTCFYPELSVLCDLHAVLDEKITAYRIWQTYYTPESITKELQLGGFEVMEIWGSLMGETLTESSPVIGILCKKA